jgi:glyceraldehyde 3-phosphate dehydrogenase
MTVRVGINGFGRVGRSFARAVLARADGADVEIVAINDPFGDAHTMAFLLKHDSVAGVIPNEVKETADGFAVDGREIAKLDLRDAGSIPWRKHGVDVVIESTGLFTSRAKAAAHLDAGAKRVIVSAPSNDADVTICLGVNDASFDSAKHRVVSNASCTTNCLAPMARVLHERFGIEKGFITTVHAYTGDQQLQDQAVVSRSGKVDLRRMRAAALSIIPSSTGAARAIGLVLPELNGKLDGLALRVPTPTGSVVDLVATLKVAPSVDEVNRAFVEASGDSSYHGHMKYTDEPLVSADIVGDDASCIFSARDTMAMDRTVKVLGWYDNESGYSHRLVDLVEFVGNT